MTNYSELIEHHEKQCNKIANGICTTRRCMNRGGYNHQAKDFDAATQKATCEALETAIALRASAAPAQEPVGWRVKYGNGDWVFYYSDPNLTNEDKSDWEKVEPLFTHSGDKGEK